jgi:hypothetical protein
VGFGVGLAVGLDVGFAVGVHTLLAFSLTHTSNVHWALLLSSSEADMVTGVHTPALKVFVAGENAIVGLV